MEPLAFKVTSTTLNFRLSPTMTQLLKHHREHLRHNVNQGSERQGFAREKPDGAVSALEASLDGHGGDVLAAGADDELLVAAGDLEPGGRVMRGEGGSSRQRCGSKGGSSQLRRAHMLEVSRDALSPECSHPSASIASWGKGVTTSHTEDGAKTTGALQQHHTRSTNQGKGARALPTSFFFVISATCSFPSSGLQR